MFSRRGPHHKRSSSSYNSNVTSAAAAPSSAAGHANSSPINDRPLVSPLQMTFDFELDLPPPSTPPDSAPPSPFSPSVESPARPRTSHGLPSETNSKASGLAPMLPPIPRVASRVHNRDESNGPESQEYGGKGKGKARDDGDNASISSKKGALKARLSFEHPVELMPPLSRPTTAGGSERPRTAGGSSNYSTPKMESSLFPSRNASPALAQSSNMPTMSRQFIDSRDKPYSPPLQRPFALQHNHSSPNLLGTASGTTKTTPPQSSSRNFSSPQASIQNLSQKSNFSGTTARPSTQASTFTAHSASPTVTIGTPYGATADSFPLPQLVKTRPKTPGQTSTVAGVSVPTHYTHGLKSVDKPNESKRKTRLLNPLSLLQRRRSNQDPEVVVEERSQRQAQAQALARQRDVVTSGVYKPPPDFDPRIKGKVVHDFSAPRGKRNTFDEMDMPVSPALGMQGSSGMSSPSTPGYPPRNASLLNRERPGENSKRRSTHTPVFMEHLSENPEAARRISLIQAENLENKDFLQRASKHSSVTTYSQESAVLPPFARRSQILDPAQAALYNDDDSKSSSNPSSEKERNSNLSSMSQVSPVTARSSHQNADFQTSFSPISPSSPANVSQREFDTSQTGSQQRPVSDLSGVPSQEDGNRPISDVSKVSSDKQSKHLSELTARPYSVIMAPPAINTIAEGSSESSPVEPSSQHGPWLAPQVLTRGTSYRSSNSPSPAQGAGSEAPTGQEVNDSSAGQSVLERTTPERTPEPESVDSIQFKPSKDQARLVEKRASAVGHSRKSSGGPKHHASNASQFSFQYGTESAAQEQALEDKHRKMRDSQIDPRGSRARSPDDDEDEDDYFDEDAMDDMDEMEMQASHEPATTGDHLTIPTQSSLYLQQARQALQQPDSDEGSVYDDEIPHVTKEEDVPYPDHPAFRTHSALWENSRHNSYQSPDGYWRGSTIDHYMRDSYMPNQQSRPQSTVSGLGIDTHNLTPVRSQNDHLSPNDNLPGSSKITRPPSNVYSQSLPADSMPTTSSQKPAVPERNSGNSERNREVSGMKFSSPVSKPATEEQSASARDSAGQDYASPDRAHHISDMSYSTVSDRSSHAAESSVPATANSRMSERSGGTPLSSPQFERDRSTSLERGKNRRNDSLDATSLASPTRAKFVGRSGDGGLSMPDKPDRPEDRSSSSNVQKSASPPAERGESSNFTGWPSQEPSSKAIYDHEANASSMSFEDFARDGFSRMESPSTPPVEKTEQKTLKPTTPPAWKEDPMSPKNGMVGSRASEQKKSPTGLGLSTFAGFDFHDRSPPPMSATTGSGSAHFSPSEKDFGSPHAIGSPTAVKNAQEASRSANDEEHYRPQRLASPASASASLQKVSGVNAKSTFRGFQFGDQQGLPSSASNEPQRGKQDHQRYWSNSSAGPSERTVPAHAGVNRLSGFDIGGGNMSGPTSTNLASQPAKPSMNYDSMNDDMYFDDGNFAADINDSHGHSIDENAFDDDAFLARPGMSSGGVNHRRDRSSAALTVASLGSDGPYPLFALPNAARTSARMSQMMLEDLPLRDPDNNPKYIPQRNPSEDMKRLGMSKKVPPVPVPENDREAFSRMQSNLQNYHASLAEAATRAAAEGRFLRAPSNASTTASSKIAEDSKSMYSQDERSAYEDKSMYSNDEDGGEIAMPYGRQGIDRSTSHLTHMTTYSPPKMNFDFGFDHHPGDDYDDQGSFGNDDDLVAAANAEVLANDDAGFYGQEFGFYGRPRANSGDLEAVNGGFFGEDGDDGLMRNKSLREPNLTPITERSEFSTRNSFVGLGMNGPFGPASASAYGPHSPALARMPMTPLMDTEVTSFDELRRLKANAFSGGGGSNSSLHSQSNRSSQHSLQAAFSPTAGSRPQQSYFGGAPMQFGYSTDSNGSNSNSNPNSARPISNHNPNFQDSPRSTASSNGLPFAMDVDATPKRNQTTPSEPTTARKVPPAQHGQSNSNGNGNGNGNGAKTHSRNGSGADSVTYVREPDPENRGKPRWVLERRRTSEQGNLELIGRELVQGGWI